MRKLRDLGGFVWKKKWLIVIVLVVLGGLIIGPKLGKKTKPLKTEHPVRQNLSQTVEVSGYVDAGTKASLRFVAGGKVVYLGAKEGDTVKKWQTIATIDQRDLQTRLDKNLNLYMNQRWSWDQTLDDTKDRTIPKKEERTVDNSQRTLANTVLDVQLADIAISNTVMSAPFGGILVSAPTSVSGVVLSAADAFQLVDPQTLIFKAGVDEADIGKVKVGMTAKIKFDAYPNEEIQASISKISLQSSAGTSGTIFVVDLPLSTQDLSTYRLGMNGDVLIQLATTENVLSVPLAATKEMNGVWSVQVEDNYRPVTSSKSLVGLISGLFKGNPAPTIKEVAIEPGLQTDEFVEIKSGLSESDLVVVPE